MRLNAIKLSGFKSFVDATNFDTQSQCVGVVGPNGCGKSNIMDAVRWVLGESRAGELRGESMQDVIFNGSTTRKPAFKAIVELVFDNTSNRLQGEWGRYDEVSVKRSLSRDGNSNYYINNQVVRRKDIHDMFMGTGLGPKAYAIIGQGMIAKIIEAKPEELRVFLEEAAGVSKYKERRKETYSRLQDTQENLLRIQDLLNEIASQLEKLAEQAGTARQYQELHRKLLQTEYLYLNWHINNEKNKQQNLHSQIAEIKAKIEDLNKQILDNELQQNNLTNNNELLLSNLNEAQSAFNELNNRITQLEERKNFQQQQQQTLAAALAEAKNALADQQYKIESLSEQKYQLEAELEEILIAQEIELENNGNENKLDEILAQEKTITQTLQNHKNNHVQLQQQSKLIEQKQQLLLQNIAGKHQRYTKMQQELTSLQHIEAQDINILNQDLENQKNNLIELNKKLEELQNSLQHQQKQHSEATQKVQAESIEMNRLQANFNALEGITKNADNKLLIEYANTKKASHLNALFKVHASWEVALAVLLQHRFNAYCTNLEDIDLAKFIDSNPENAYCFVELNNNYPIEADKIHVNSLLNYVEIKNIQAKASLQQWLSSYIVADNIQDAIKNRKSLAVGQSFILNNGTLVDAFSITTYHNIAQNALINKRKLDDLVQQIKAQQLILEQSKGNLSDSLNMYTHQQHSYNDLQNNIRNNTKSIAEQQLAVDKILQQQEFAKTRLASYHEDMYELQAEMSIDRENHAELGFSIEEILEKIYAIEEEISTHEQKYNILKNNIEQERQKSQSQQLKAQALVFKQQNIKQNLERIFKEQKEANETIAKAQIKINEWQKSITELEPEIIQKQLLECIEGKEFKEYALQQAQNNIGEYHQQVQALQSIAKELQSKLLPLYDAQHQTDLNAQAAQLNCEQYQEQLIHNIEQLIKSLPNANIENIHDIEKFPDLNLEQINPNHFKASSISTLKQNINIIKQEIEALGSVNLAAIQELEHTQERHNSLQHQFNDITTAIQTLQDAIAKIDEETRILLQDTFNRVNAEFAHLFPELFGGGNAKLSLVGDADMLSSGIQVLAQPPGKKNATIHLLSGGEKALTAIALVFAIFALNPAPFCLLDEVDAPLDDANTERYAKLIRKMSEKTQFLFISHNKIAMEIAEQLIGVTMQEQGVSRVVSVDMVEALQVLS
jgi:chromosome segregation protein